MIDFINIISKISSYEDYLNRKDIKFIEGIRNKKEKPLPYFWYKNDKDKSLIRVGYKNWINFTGSIAKYFYTENYTNLTYSDLVSAIHDISDYLDIDPKNTDLRSFEYGLNIHPNFDMDSLDIKDLALNYKNLFFEDFDSESKKSSIGKKCKLNQYHIKLYSKSEESELPFDLLRFEIKIKKMQIIKKIGITTLYDLTNKDKLNMLKLDLIDKLDKILIYDDSINTKLLDSKDKDLCKNWLSDVYRKRLLEHNPSTFKYQRKKLEKLISLHGKNEVKNNLIKSISETWDELLDN